MIKSIKSKKEFYSLIATPLHISDSEIAIMCPDYQYDWIENQVDKLKGVLFDLGANIAQHFEYQEPMQHRNRLGNVVTCGRYYCEERSDFEWLSSGYASTAAKDKALNCRLLDDVYRSRALTIDAQLALESKDKYNVVEDNDNDNEGDE